MKFGQAVFVTHLFTLLWAATSGQGTLSKSGSDVTKVTRNRGIVQREYQEISKNLTTFVTDLKAYTDDETFEYQVFLHPITSFREKLADIEFAVESSQNDSGGADVAGMAK